MLFERIQKSGPGAFNLLYFRLLVEVLKIKKRINIFIYLITKI